MAKEIVRAAVKLMTKDKDGKLVPVKMADLKVGQSAAFHMADGTTRSFRLAKRVTVDEKGKAAIAAMRKDRPQVHTRPKSPWDDARAAAKAANPEAAHTHTHTHAAAPAASVLAPVAEPAAAAPAAPAPAAAPVATLAPLSPRGVAPLLVGGCHLP